MIASTTPKQASKQASKQVVPSLTEEQLRAQAGEMLREELRQLLADPAALRALLLAKREALSRAEGPRWPALLSFAGAACPTVEATGTKTDGMLTRWSGASGGTVTDSVIKQDSSGKIGIGTTTPGGPLDVAATLNSVNSGDFFVRMQPTITDTSVGSGTFYNLFFYTYFPPSQTITATAFAFHGVNSVFDIRSGFSGTVYLRGFYETSIVYASASGTVAQYNGFDSAGPYLSDNNTLTITDLSHFYARDAVKESSDGTITNQYGLYVKSQSIAVSRLTITEAAANRVSS